MSFVQAWQRPVGNGTVALTGTVTVPAATVNGGTGTPKTNNLLIGVFCLRNGAGYNYTLPPPAGWELVHSTLDVKVGVRTIVLHRRAGNSTGTDTLTLDWSDTLGGTGKIWYGIVAEYNDVDTLAPSLGIQEVGFLYTSTTTATATASLTKKILTAQGQAISIAAWWDALTPTGNNITVSPGFTIDTTYDIVAWTGDSPQAAFSSTGTDTDNQTNVWSWVTGGVSGANLHILLTYNNTGGGTAPDWTLTNVTGVVDAIGVGGGDKTASTITAINGAVEHSIKGVQVTASGTHTSRWWLKAPVTLSGEIDITLNAGAGTPTWTRITKSTIGRTTFTSHVLAGTVTNPQIGLRLTGSTDKIIVGNAELFIGMTNSAAIQGVPHVYNSTANIVPTQISTSNAYGGNILPNATAAWEIIPANSCLYPMDEGTGTVFNETINDNVGPANIIGDAAGGWGSGTVVSGWEFVSSIAMDSEIVKDHANLPGRDSSDAHPISAITGLSTQLAAIAQWETDHLENHQGGVGAEEYLMGTELPTNLPGVVPQKYHHLPTGDIYRYVGDAGTGAIGYTFDGTRVVTFDNAWESLGDNINYATIKYEGTAGLIPSLPVTAIGSGYQGAVQNLELIDSAPIQGTYVCVGSNARYFILDQYISLPSTFDISFNWIRENAYSTGVKTAVMGDGSTQGIFLWDNHDITVKVAGATAATFTGALTGKALGKQVSIRVKRNSDNTIDCWVDNIPKTKSAATIGTMTINSFGKGDANEYLAGPVSGRPGSALHNIQIIDSLNRLWNFALNDNTGTIVDNSSTETNKLAWFTNSQIYSNNIADETSIPVQIIRKGIMYYSGGEESGSNMSETYAIPGTNPIVRSGYFISSTREDGWRYSIPPQSSDSNPPHPEYDLLANRILHKDDPLVIGPDGYGETFAGPGFYSLNGNYVHRAYWHRPWKLVGTSRDKCRAEMHVPGGLHLDLNSEYWFGFALWVPDTENMRRHVAWANNLTNGNNCIVQFHNGTSPRSFQLTSDGFYLGIAGHWPYMRKALVRPTILFGQWNTFVVNVKTMTDPTAMAKVWINTDNANDAPDLHYGPGTAQVGGYDPNLLVDFKMGLYCGGNTDPETRFTKPGILPYNYIVRFYDEYRFGKVNPNDPANSPGFADVYPLGGTI